MSLLSIKSHSCLQEVTSVGKKSLLFVPVIVFTWKPLLQLKKTLLFYQKSLLFAEWISAKYPSLIRKRVNRRENDTSIHSNFTKIHFCFSKKKSHFCPPKVTSVLKNTLLFSHFYSFPKIWICGAKSHFCFYKSHFCSLFS